MKRIGAFVGKFLPPHIGHLSIIDKMIKECDECVVVVSDNPEKSKKLCEDSKFPYFTSLERINWFKNHYKNNAKILYAIIDESKIKDSKNFMQDYAKLFWESVPYKVNAKYGDESYRELNEKYFPNCEFVAIDRDAINVHGTNVREEYKKYKKYIMPEAKIAIDSALKKKDKLIEKIKEVGINEWAKNNINKKNTIKKLLVKYATHYYRGKALILDADFDFLIDVLRLIDAKDPFLHTPGWGYEEKNSVKHKYCRINGLSYYFDYKSVKEIFSDENELVILPKYDGINYVAYYKNGKFDYSATRGNGFVGKNISKKYKPEEFTIPKDLQNKDFAINGEIIYDDKNAENKSDFRDKAGVFVGKRFKIKSLTQKIKYMPFGLLNTNYDYFAQLKMLKKMYYEKITTHFCKELPLEEELKKLFKKYGKDYAIDGLVITNKSKTIQIAYKFKGII